MKGVADDYYCQNKRQVRSYADTLNEIKNLTQQQRRHVTNQIKEANKTIVKEQKTWVEKFDKTLEKVDKANSLLQKIKKYCKPVSSFVAIFAGDQKDCMGHEIKDYSPNQVLDKSIGSTNVKTSLREVIRLIDPNDDVGELEINGKNFLFLLHTLQTLSKSS